MLLPLTKLGELPKPADLIDIPANGVQGKPQWCYNSCPRAHLATSFVPDYVPENPSIAIVSALPAREDAAQCIPFASGYGRFFWGAIGRKYGLRKQNVIVSNLLRCYTYKYPVGATLPKAERACRHFDYYCHGGHGRPVRGLRSIATWNPNIYVVTFSIEKMLEVDALMALAIEDFGKAVRFIKAGYRPCVLLGTEVLKAVAPWLKGGARDWRGTWWEGDWPFKDPETETRLKVFAEPAPKYKRDKGPRAKAAPKLKPGPELKQGSLF